MSAMACATFGLAAFCCFAVSVSFLAGSQPPTAKAMTGRPSPASRMPSLQNRFMGSPVFARNECKKCSRKPRTWVCRASAREYPTEESLEIAGFGDRRVHRVVRRLMAFLGDFQEPVEVAAALEQNLAQAVTVQVVGTGAGHQYAVLRQHLHRHLVQALVGEGAFLRIFLALDECRRIEDDDVEALALRAQPPQDFKGIVTLHGYLFGYAVEFGVTAYPPRG